MPTNTKTTRNTALALKKNTISTSKDKTCNRLALAAATMVITPQSKRNAQRRTKSRMTKRRRSHTLPVHASRKRVRRVRLFRTRAASAQKFLLKRAAARYDSRARAKYQLYSEFRRTRWTLYAKRSRLPNTANPRKRVFKKMRQQRSWYVSAKRASKIRRTWRKTPVHRRFIFRALLLRRKNLASLRRVTRQRRSILCLPGAVRPHHKRTRRALLSIPTFYVRQRALSSQHRNRRIWKQRQRRNHWKQRTPQPRKVRRFVKRRRLTRSSAKRMRLLRSLRRAFPAQRRNRRIWKQRQRRNRYRSLLRLRRRGPRRVVRWLSATRRQYARLVANKARRLIRTFKTFRRRYHLVQYVARLRRLKVRRASKARRLRNKLRYRRYRRLRKFRRKIKLIKRYRRYYRCRVRNKHRPKYRKAYALRLKRVLSSGRSGFKRRRYFARALSRYIVRGKRRVMRRSLRLRRSITLRKRVCPWTIRAGQTIIRRRTKRFPRRLRVRRRLFSTRRSVPLKRVQLASVLSGSVRSVRILKKSRRVELPVRADMQDLALAANTRRVLALASVTTKRKKSPRWIFTMSELALVVTKRRTARIMLKRAQRALRLPQKRARKIMKKFARVGRLLSAVAELLNAPDNVR